jgi:hypothetical protein
MSGIHRLLTALQCTVAPRRKSNQPCLFCERSGEPSREHIIPKWLREALQIQGRVEEYREDTLVGTWDTLAVVLPRVCVTCNTGWMNKLETRVQPLLGPLLLGARPGQVTLLDPSQQATLACWAVQKSLLLAMKKYRNQEYGWIPVDSLNWLYHRRRADQPPPGSRVWMGGVQTKDRPSWMKIGLLSDEDGKPAAHCGTFSVGCVLFQVFCCPQTDANHCSETEKWLAAHGPFRYSLLPIAPSFSVLRWPPAEVFTVDALPLVAGRLQHGLDGQR